MTESQRWAKELQHAEKWLLRVLKGLKDAQARRNPPRGTRSIARVLWHLAEVDAHVIAMIEKHPPVFPLGSDEARATRRTPVPPLATLLRAVQRCRRDLVARVRRLTPAALKGRGYGKMTVAETLRAVTWHGVYHAGQIAMVRRLTGKALGR